MPHQYTTSLAACCSLFCISSVFVKPASAEPVDFRAWLEGPTEVQAGETATITAWVSASGVELEDSRDDFFSGVALDIAVGGDLNSFVSISEVIIGDVQALIDNGTPDNNILQDVIVVQFPGLPSTNPANPLRLFTFDIETMPDTNGVLSISQFAAFNTSLTAPQYAWHINGSTVFSDDPGNSLTIDPFSFQVIPAPGVAALLTLVGLGATRRRR